MNKIESVEIILNYKHWEVPESPKNITDGVVEIFSKDGQGNEIESDYSELTPEWCVYFSINDLIQDVARHLNVSPSKVKIMNAIARVEVCIDPRDQQISSVTSIDDNDTILKEHHELAYYNGAPTAVVISEEETNYDEVMDYIVSKLKHLNVDSSMVEITEE